MTTLLGTVAAANSPALKTPTEALEVVQGTSLPDGVTLTGTVEKIDQPDAEGTCSAGDWVDSAWEAVEAVEAGEVSVRTSSASCKPERAASKTRSLDMTATTSDTLLRLSHEQTGELRVSADWNMFEDFGGAPSSSLYRPCLKSIN
ncbi:hypothetical protein BBJ28_00024356 [Nothophytophthora sp. Chile5]|nr:hypothetical protein BBJ28_00024356 [Nothophytophthora sp. Chile5]